MAGLVAIRQSQMCAFIRRFFPSRRIECRTRLAIGFMEKHIVELPHIDHFPASAALVKVFFLRFARDVRSD
jgi:hypothetical protein